MLPGIMIIFPDHFPGNNDSFSGAFCGSFLPDHPSGSLLNAIPSEMPLRVRTLAEGASQDSGQRAQSWETSTRSESKFLNWVSSI